MKKMRFAALLVPALWLATAAAQEGNPAAPPPHAHAGDQARPQDTSQQDTSMAGMKMDIEEHEGFQLPSPHEGSGTAWQPGSVRGYEWMWMSGGWEFMAHGAIFLDYNQAGRAAR